MVTRRIASSQLFLLLPLLMTCACDRPDESAAPPDPGPLPGPGVLVFTKTAGYRHESILAGVTAVKALGAERGWSVIHTENGAVFNPRTLARFKVVVWLNTTGDVLHAAEQRAFQSYIESGGGYVGVHSAADTEYGWDWYGELLGTRFKGHPSSPNVRNADIVVERHDHPATAMFPERWNRDDEWYNFRDNPRHKPGITVLAALDEKTYPGGAMGDHPIVWCQRVGKGRALYTALGHTAESYADPLFRRHLAGAIAWAGDMPAVLREMASSLTG